MMLRPILWTTSWNGCAHNKKTLAPFVVWVLWRSCNLHIACVIKSEVTNYMSTLIFNTTPRETEMKIRIFWRSHSIVNLRLTSINLGKLLQQLRLTLCRLSGCNSNCSPTYFFRKWMIFKRVQLAFKRDKYRHE